ncbi:MAG TPA: hypothetical protein VGM91_02910 [Conexibacter sp.]|jgi:hypothetical protein
MGLFKRANDRKSLIGAAPETVRTAQEMQALELSAAQQAAAEQQPAASQAASDVAAPADASVDFAPIAGVSIELYAEISRALAGVGYDQSQAPAIAADR